MLIEEEFNIPEWAMIYLSYGRDESLSREEIALIDNWLKRAGYTVGDFYSCEESHHFSHFPEFGKPCNVYVGLFVKEEIISDQ
ncbi:DUF6926 domain-containing protein [Cerasicoccus frondis]|uniref:DUF6926 domain-containing protein n=1 Tax=Cerasicoccus frondis TaxID=490090 RepID=UPI0028526412|nr:hypothetical protein [Cerasicoccus frondis]